MKDSLLFLFSLFISSLLIGQIESKDKLNASIIEAQNLLTIYKVNSSSFDCPPKLIRSSEDTLLYFLNALLPESENEKEIFLNAMMDNNCNAYFACRILDDHSRPIYSELMKEHSNSGIYEMLPIALSGSNPGLQIDGDRAGIWQLSYVNARRFGLQIDDLIDERYDLSRSTYAAIQYFMFLEKIYPNRPLLVISAFYTSVPYVNKHLSSLDENTDNAFLSSVDADLRSFLIYLLTWNEWIVNFKSYNKNDLIGKAQKKWKNVEIRDTVEISVLAEFLGLNQDVLRKMNPIWVGNEITKSKGHPFYLPKNKADFIEAHYDGFINFQQELIDKEKEELIALKFRMKNDVPDPKKYKAVNYKVKSGDVLGLIAQRYGVKVSSIKKWNKLSSDRINIGQDLVLYIPNDKAVDLPEEKADNKIEVANTEPKPGVGSYTSYTVKNGESLWLIARKFPGISSENIMEWNGISDKIKPGQVLKIYGGE